MPALIDLIGQRFGRWIVLTRSERRDSRGQIYWLCRCSCVCGTERTVLGESLRAGKSRSCGCLMIIHGHARNGGSRTYRCWQAMHQRCSNPCARGYADYGGRNISVCARWHSFMNFLADMGEPPPGMSIDRRNNDGPYAAWNCRWATAREQVLNRRPAKRKRRRAELADILAYADALARAAGRTRSAP
jgi:hypothetical protein